MLARWKKLSSSLIRKNPWWEYKLDSFQIPNGVKGEYHYVHTDGSSLIIPVTAERTFVLVRQYRYLNDKESIEFPCGGVKANHSYELMARLELEEEAGYRASSWEVVGEFNPFNGATDEMCRVFLARGLTAVPAKPEQTEEFEILTLTKEEVEKAIAAGEIWDGMTLAAWMLARNRFVANQENG